MNQELEDYIKKAREAGASDEQIKKDLLEAGWGEGDIQNLLHPKQEETASVQAPVPPAGYEIKDKNYKIRGIIFGIYLVYSIIGAYVFFFLQDAAYKFLGFFLFLPSGYLALLMGNQKNKKEKSPLWLYIIFLILITMLALPFFIAALPR